MAKWVYCPRIFSSRIFSRYLVPEWRTMLKGTKAAVVFMAFTTPALSACEAKPINFESKTASAKSICGAAKLPIGANGIRVTLDATFISDRKERSLLQDESCPNIVVVPFDRSNTVKDKGYQAFSRILDANPLRVGLVTARVTIYGTLRMDAPARYRLDVIRYIRSNEQKTR